MTLEGMTAVGLVHGFGAFAAVLTGTAMMLGAKGTRRHRLSGMIYIPLMIAVNASALGIYGLTGGFNVFHLLALVNLTSTLLGVRALLMWRRTRSPDWLKAHQYHLAYSYLGLMMALVSELLLNPRFGLFDGFRHYAAFWISVGLLNIPIYWAGSRFIRRKLDPVQA
ncbi:MAG: DUF2306 domain-containing protein [Alphaproteobacteria bacterium]|nr:DUF2306 domain-containing protein [Alphaproteobacteria bacterium]